MTLADPGTDFTPDMVMSYYSNMYPELTTATVHGPVIREDMDKRIGHMKKNDKDEKSCVPLDEHRLAQLARLIIGQTRRNVRYGVDREERITAPSGAVILF